MFSHFAPNKIRVMPMPQPLTSCCSCAVCVANAGSKDGLGKVNTTADQSFKLRCLTVMKLGAEMLDIIKLWFKIPVKT